MQQPSQNDLEQSSIQGSVRRRLALIIEYEGTKYAGFQLQLEEPTIQGELEKALNKFTGEGIRIRGASRTDSGAHAVGQVVDFESESTHPPETFVGALNYYLPRDIRVARAVDVGNDFHSRRGALSRVYQYRILNRLSPSPLYRRHYHWVREPLSVEMMNLAAQDLVGTHDFRPFVPGHPVERSAVREVHRWEVATGKDDEHVVVITSEASGFMQHQIRRTNAVLVEIGKGNLPYTTVRSILNQDQNSEVLPSVNSIPTLPAKGLWLMRVNYRNSWAQGEIDYEEK